jgi:CheY-like chemotaxis protein
MRDTKCILVVEDEKAVRTLCRYVLENAGFRVLEAANGIEAREILQTNDDISLLLCDLVMPMMSGPDLVQEILPQRPGLKVLYMTSYADEQRLLDEHIREWGCSLLHKPFTTSQLVSRVRSLLQALPIATVTQ